MQNCDVVMKGGITSGIVYPGAVCELAKDFRFVNIGGTSAGAIAAALTAAAEYRRQMGSGAGFEELARLPAWLAGGGDRARLLRLFQPDAESAAIFEVALALAAGKGSLLRRLVASAMILVRRYNRYGGVVLAAGALAVLIALAAAWLSARHSLSVAAGAVLLALGIIVVTGALFLFASVAEALVSMWRVLPRQGFGLCSGMSASGDALTQWLSAKIDEVAGVASPLTFGDLKRAGVKLEMMTTSLTHGRPYRLPFTTRQFDFAPSDMRRLSTENVVQSMLTRARPRTRSRVSGTGEELVALPSADDLPVVVATRMSLSFPLLLEAVPLWATDFGRRDVQPRPERCWFSDGGITSNFPVHFFDRPLPRWPTFAFNLADRTARYHDAGQGVYVPRTNRGGILEWWTPLETPGDFFRSIFATMQNWRDNMLLRLPGQRDRIAHVLLDPDEGGLNLTMKPETIERVAQKGAEAARTFRSRFAGSPPPDVTLTWPNHKWVRFLAFMPALEQMLESWSTAFSDPAVPSLDALLSGAERLPSYRVQPTQREAMHRASIGFLQHVNENFGARPFRSVARRPRPEPVLRAMPQE